MPAHAHVFKQFLNDWFLETGTYKGEGIDTAISVGFKKLISIDIFPKYYNEAVAKYETFDYINLGVFAKMLLGPTELKLKDAIELVPANENITYWLDAHYSNQNEDGTETPKSEVNCPLLAELEIIRNSNRTEDIILIDDIRCCDSNLFDYISRKDLENACLKINPNYTIYYLDSWEKNDILVARIV